MSVRGSQGRQVWGEGKRGHRSLTSCEKGQQELGHAIELDGYEYLWYAMISNG